MCKKYAPLNSGAFLWFMAEYQEEDSGADFPVCAPVALDGQTGKSAPHIRNSTLRTVCSPQTNQVHFHSATKKSLFRRICGFKQGFSLNSP